MTYLYKMLWNISFSADYILLLLKNAGMLHKLDKLNWPALNLDETPPNLSNSCFQIIGDRKHDDDQHSEFYVKLNLRDPSNLEVWFFCKKYQSGDTRLLACLDTHPINTTWFLYPMETHLFPFIMFMWRFGILDTVNSYNKQDHTQDDRRRSVLIIIQPSAEQHNDHQQ